MILLETKKPQHQRVLEMLKSNPDGVTTGEFCSTIGLASEYRRAISELRRKGHVVNAERLREGQWLYSLGK
jgi:hypothetical protein